MEFHEKLQQLRKHRELTQEELAEKLFVSRTAVSKWESGRGYPNIDSLKALSKFFGVSIDELLSGEELLTLAEEKQQQDRQCFSDLIFGLLDLGAALFLFLPLFSQRSGENMQAVALPALTGMQPYMKAACFAVIIAAMALGAAALALQNHPQPAASGHRNRLSLLLSAAGTLLFTLSRQPYAAVLALFLLLAKTRLLLKQR